MPFEKVDYKKADKALYLPPKQPVFVEIPRMRFIAVDGRGAPASPAYQDALALIYSITFTIKMSKMSGDTPPDYHDYALPPLEGLWWMPQDSALDFRQKEQFQWRSLMRLPEYVNEDVFAWAVQKARQKNPQLDYTQAQYLVWQEGLCCQCMHIGSYDDEPATIEMLGQVVAQNSYELAREACLADGTPCAHHEIYISDPRKTAPEKLKTVLRFPVRKTVD